MEMTCRPWGSGSVAPCGDRPSPHRPRPTTAFAERLSIRPGLEGNSPCYPDHRSMGRLAHDLLGSGVRLRVYEHSPEQASALLLVHGLFVDARTWDPIAELLAPEHRVIYPDLPGFGESEKPPQGRFPYSVDAFAEVLVDLVSALGLARAAVVGHGLGGAIALTLAARHPELVSRLVLVDASCHPSALGTVQRALLVPIVGGVVYKQLLSRTVYRALFRDRLLSATGTVRTERIDGFFDSISSPAARGSLLATLRATADSRAVSAQTTRLVTPTLVVWGRHDKLHPVAHGQKLARDIRGAGLELLDSGHCPQEECPERLAHSIRRFLKTARPGSS
jgi:pimeloyl-ACP methyl ester carboxylesterase